MNKKEKHYTIWLEGKTFKSSLNYIDVDYRLEEFHDGLVYVRWVHDNSMGSEVCSLDEVLDLIKTGQWVINEKS